MLWNEYVLFWECTSLYVNFFKFVYLCVPYFQDCIYNQTLSFYKKCFSHTMYVLETCFFFNMCTYRWSNCQRSFTSLNILYEEFLYLIKWLLYLLLNELEYYFNSGMWIFFCFVLGLTIEDYERFNWHYSMWKQSSLIYI